MSSPEETIKDKLKALFEWDTETYTELDDIDIMKKLEEARNRKFVDILKANGFVKNQLFNQISVYWNHILDCVITSEYSDNTGLDYWRYFDSIEEYNELVCLDSTGVR